MVVQHNLTAMNANRYFGINNSNLSKSLEKLSSGYAINRAGDNAAGLAVSEKMRAQISGLTQASKNAEDGISMVQTYEGALTETDSILQRMRSLAVQSANGSYDNNVDRVAIEQEFKQLNDELDQIADTDFNGVIVLNGGEMADGLKVDANNNFDYANYVKPSVYEVKTTAALDAKISIAADPTKDATDNPDNAATYTYFDGNAVIGTTASGKKISAGAAGFYDVDALMKQHKAANADVTATAYDGAEVKITSTDSTATPSWATDVVGKAKAGDTLTIAKKVSVSNAESNAAGKLTYADSISLQVGARTKDLVNFTFAYDSDGIGDLDADLNCTAKGLGTDKLSLLTQESANDAIDKIDHAINKVSMVRGTFGAIQNRLEHKIDNIDTTNENLTAAESRIRDTDMASEMMEFTKNQILSQASQSMLAQANQLPQGVLSLLQ